MMLYERIGLVLTATYSKQKTLNNIIMHIQQKNFWAFNLLGKKAIEKITLKSDGTETEILNGIVQLFTEIVKKAI